MTVQSFQHEASLQHVIGCILEDGTSFDLIHDPNPNKVPAGWYLNSARYWPKYVYLLVPKSYFGIVRSCNIMNDLMTTNEVFGYGLMSKKEFEDEYLGKFNVIEDAVEDVEHCQKCGAFAAINCSIVGCPYGDKKDI